MHVLVTGGAGFVGSHLATALLAAGRAVTVLDDLSTGVAGRVPAGARWVRGDVRDAGLVDDLVGEADRVLHFAAAVGAALVARDPAATWSRNVLGTAALLDACARHGRRVVLASSSEVYGPEREGPLHEEDPLVVRAGGRREVYALSKAAGEAYAVALHRTRLLPVTILRLFNVVGRGQSGRYGMVLPRFVEAARAGRPLTVYGDGSQRRCFLHVEDAVRAVLDLLETPGAEGLAVNVGSDEEVAVADLAALVLRESGSSGGVRLVPFEHAYGEGFRDPARRVPDLARLRRLTGFRPQRTLKDAVRDLLGAGRAAPS